ALQPDYLLAHGRRPPRPPLLSLHDALPILREPRAVLDALAWCEGVMLGREAYHRPYVLAELHRALHPGADAMPTREALIARMERSEEHTSELQSLRHLVCRLLLEKKKDPKH